jgi:hypothetical protein
MDDLTLWVMEGVLTDYTDGLVCVLARTEGEAWDLLKAKDRAAEFVLRQDGATFRRIESPEAFVVWGGA